MFASPKTVRKRGERTENTNLVNLVAEASGAVRNTAVGVAIADVLGSSNTSAVDLVILSGHFGSLGDV